MQTNWPYSVASEREQLPDGSDFSQIVKTKKLQNTKNYRTHPRHIGRAGDQTDLTVFGLIFWSWQFIPSLEKSEPLRSCSLSDATESGQLVCIEKQYEIQPNYSRHRRDSEKPPISGNKWSSPFKHKKVNPVQKGECQSASSSPDQQ